jgi:hypothetical protein
MRILKILIVFFAVSFLQIAFPQDNVNKLDSTLNIELSVYPDNVKSGDIVFLKYTYKNNTTRPIWLSGFCNISFSSPQGTTTWKRFAYGGAGGGIEPEVEYGGSFFTVEPAGGTFEIYDAVLIQSREKHDVTFDKNTDNNVGKSSFVDEILNSSDDKHFFYINYHYSDNRTVSKKINITQQQEDQTELLLKFYNRQLPEFYDKKHIEDKGIVVIDKKLSYAMNVATTKGLDSLLNKLKSGTLKDWLILNKNIPIDRYDDTVFLIANYETPEDAFWKWLHKLPDIQRNYIVINVLKKYYGLQSDARLILKQPNRSAQDKQKLETIRKNYKKDSKKYDKFLNDWLPLLPQNNGEAAYLKKFIFELSPNMKEFVQLR